MNKRGNAIIAETYYDSSDADAFYELIWGGEDIHVGIYENPGEEIALASHKTVELMAEKINDIDDNFKILDLGAGYGGSARYLAKNFNCHIDCLNISEVQNNKNRIKNKSQNLENCVNVFHGNFEAIPFDDATYDCVWSQDSILHSNQKASVFEEISRVLKPGGQLVFSDPMQKNELATPKLAKVFERIHLDSMGYPELYKNLAAKNRINIIEFNSKPESLKFHYSNVLGQLENNQKVLSEKISLNYIESMKVGLKHWISASESGLLDWGIFHGVKL